MVMPANFKIPIIRDRKYLDFLHGERCIISGQYGNANETVDPAHVGKHGLHIKIGDDCTLPLMHRYHAKQDEIGEASMYRTFLPDDVLMAALRALARERYQEWLSQQLNRQRVRA